jgi:hypothetical protein
MVRKRNKETKNTPPSVTETGEDFFYYERPAEDETIAELMIRTSKGARIRHTIIHVHSPESEYYDNEKTAYVSRFAAGEHRDNEEKDETEKIAHISKLKRISKNPERTRRALARLANIVKLRGHKEKGSSSEA